MMNRAKMIKIQRQPKQQTIRIFRCMCGGGANPLIRRDRVYVCTRCGRTVKGG